MQSLGVTCHNLPKAIRRLGVERRWQRAGSTPHSVQSKRDCLILHATSTLTPGRNPIRPIAARQVYIPTTNDHHLTPHDLEYAVEFEVTWRPCACTCCRFAPILQTYWGVTGYGGSTCAWDGDLCRRNLLQGKAIAYMAHKATTL